MAAVNANSGLVPNKDGSDASAWHIEWEKPSPLDFTIGLMERAQVEKGKGEMSDGGC